MTSRLLTPSARLASRATRLAAQDARAATYQDLGHGYGVIRDSAPGTGWVLSCRHQPNRYFATKEQAIERHRALMATRA